MAEKQSPGGRGRQLVGREGETLETGTDTLTGQNMEQQVSTQVLLGLIEDLELQRRKVEDYEKEVEDYKKEIESLTHQIAALSLIRTIAIASSAFALLALGVTLWATL